MPTVEIAAMRKNGARIRAVESPARRSGISSFPLFSWVIANMVASRVRIGPK
jgi:hypothetical protein